jgi:hypothetical protein
VLLFLHGAIHLLGFAKAFGSIHLEQLNTNVSQISGLLWIIVFFLFLASAIAFLSKADWWYMVAFCAVIISTILIITVWNDAKYGIIANVVILIAIIIAHGTSSFHKLYEREVKTCLSQTNSISETLLTEQDIFNLPELVKKYIRYTGAVGKPKVKNFRVKFKGKIRKNNDTLWMPLTSVQYNFLDASSRFFFINAVMKGFPVAGFHCFKNGVAFMDIRLFSLIKVQYQSGNEMGIAETVTFFNDMVCMAPATLIDRRIKWLETEKNKVKAEFTNNGITISAWLYFNEKGELINFISEDRYAVSDNGLRKMPWSTPMKNYKDIDGYRLATNADTIYDYPEGELCYGTFELIHVEYNLKNLE